MLAHMKLILVAVFAAGIFVPTDAFEFVCPEAVGGTDPPIVNVSAYGYEVYISIDHLNETLKAYELYNDVNKTLYLSIDMPSNVSDGKWIKETITHDYVNNQTFVVNYDAKSCVVSDFNRNETYSLFGVGIENGFKNPQFSYKWKGDYNYTKSNKSTTVTGIPAEEYETCMTFNNGTVKYVVSLFFSDPSWNTRAGKSIPLMLVLKANQTKDNGTSFDTQSYTYSFTAFHRDTNGWTAPELPHGVVCPGRKDVVNIPAVPTDYSYATEIFNEETKSVLAGHTFYDYDDKFYRADIMVPKNRSQNSTHPSPYHHVTIIHDFLAGVAYHVDREMGNCTVKPIDNSSLWNIDVAPDPKHPGMFHMVNPVERMKEMDLTYTGRHKNDRDIMLDSWISAPMKINSKHGPLTITSTIYYTTSEWSMGNVSPIPYSQKVAINSSVNGSYHVNEMMLYFSAVLIRKHGIHTFDVGYCYTGNLTKTYVLKFSKDFYSYVTTYSVVLDEAIQSAVAKAANISKLRVGSLIEKEIGSDVADGKDFLFISVTLYDKPTVKGDTTEMIPQINLTSAVSKLRTVVEDNKLVISFMSKANKTVTMTAFPSYFEERKSLYVQQKQPPQITTGWSSGTVAALCIGIALIGFILGVTFCHFRYKRGNRQFGYGIQD